MSQPPSVIPSKAASISSKSSNSNQISPAASQTQQFFSNNVGSLRTSSGTSAAKSPATARNNQSAKPKHKHGKKFQSLDDDESAIMSQIGRRGKQNMDITHLMNIALPPRPQQQQYHRHSYNGPRRGGRSNATWGMGSGYHAMDKARYIHANYRFIVDPRGDYRAQAEDADVHLEWNDVLQIVASATTQSASCPICLGEPTAPRMAKCGHIFCMPCLIRYMHSDDGNAPPPEKKARWKKCPICFDSIYVSETRPVRWYVGQESEPREGGDIVLRLVKRKTGSTLAMPRESAETVAKGEYIPWYLAAEVMDYARMMKGSEEYMLQQYDEALAAIERLEKEDELMFGEDAEWTGRAIRMLKESKEKVNGIGNPPAQPKKPEQQPEKKVDARPPIQFNDSNDGVPEMYLQSHANLPTISNAIENHESQPVEQAPSNETSTGNAHNIPRTLNEMRQRQYEKPQPSEYLFYHGLLHFYLSPLDIRILKTAFGSYQNLPSSILPRVERISSGHIVDDELRKRVKYLAHLPYGCEVGFLECDWADLVSPRVLEEFRPMLERRRRRHDEKDAREEKERVRIEKAEERELAAVRRKRPSLPEDAFSTDFLPSLSGSVMSTTPPQNGTSASPPWPNRSTSGFASLASPSTSPSVQRTVWGTAAVASTSPDLHAADYHNANHPPMDDGWLQGWEKDLLDQQMDVQLAAAGVEGLTVQASSSSAANALTDVRSASGNVSGGGGGGKRGKKGKKIMLMSTANGARRGA